MNLIRDWYSQMDIERFRAKYSTDTDGLSSEVEMLLHDHNSWIKTSEIQGTPTFFINGYQLPRHYKIDDLMMQIYWLEDFFRDEKNMQKIESEMYFSRKD